MNHFLWRWFKRPQDVIYIPHFIRSLRSIVVAFPRLPLLVFYSRNSCASEVLYVFGPQPKQGGFLQATLQPYAILDWNYLGVCSRLSNRILLSVQSHHEEVPYMTIKIVPRETPKSSHY